MFHSPLKLEKTVAHLKGDGILSSKQATLRDGLKSALERVLPLNFDAGPCQMKILNIRALAVEVTGYTGIVNTTLLVRPEGTVCPLSQGEVSWSGRAVPKVTHNRLRITLVHQETDVPTEWKVIGFFGGRNPRSAIKNEVAKRVSALLFGLPDLNGARVAIQGINLDSKGDDIELRIKFDALIDAATITSYLAALPQFEEFSIQPPAELSH